MIGWIINKFLRIESRIGACKIQDRPSCNALVHCKRVIAYLPGALLSARTAHSSQLSVISRLGTQSGRRPVSAAKTLDSKGVKQYFIERYDYTKGAALRVRETLDEVTRSLRALFSGGLNQNVP